MGDSGTAIRLYHMPGACSQVTMVALEEIGVAYEDETVNIFRGAQHAPPYKAINPKGKVPAMRIDGALLTETPAILWHLATRFPEARLLPVGKDGAPALDGLADLCWCAGEPHAQARGVRLPMLLTEGDPAPVRDRALKKVAPIVTRLEDRFARQPWWYGDAWSIVDVYLAWITNMLGDALPGTGSAVAEHRGRVHARRSAVAAFAREQAALARDHIEIPSFA